MTFLPGIWQTVRRVMAFGGLTYRIALTGKGNRLAGLQNLTGRPLAKFTDACSRRFHI